MGVFGLLTVSADMVTNLELDWLETIVLCVAQRARAFTKYVPALLQDFGLLVELNQLDAVPSPQSN